MRKEIIKRIIAWIATVVVIIAGGYGIKTVIDNNNSQQQQVESVSYTLNTENFGGIVAYDGIIDLSKFTITKTENGQTTEIPVDASMVTTPVDTARVGTTMLKLSYKGTEFSVPVTVKYEVHFKTGDEIFETIYTLDSSELDKIEAPEKDGYNFIGWSEEIPDVLFENMHLIAQYEAIIPALPAVDATYGDELASITLPANAAGAWTFNNAEGTVGNAGKRTFDVSFIEKGTNEVLKEAKLTVNVAKREVKIDVFADFTYNGTRQEPTYKVEVEGLKVSSWPDADKNYTDAGEYNYYFEIDDANYTGVAKGTYVIKPAVVTVKINSPESIYLNAPLPKVTYEISGIEGMSQEELAEFIGLAIVMPENVTVGEHKIGATASNPSIALEVEEGTLKVIQATIEGIGEPILVSKVATYGDTINTIEFGYHPNGRWVWNTPDAAVGTVGKQTHLAVFIPSDSAFTPIEYSVEITVVPKPMDIEIIGDTTFDYDGKEHKVNFVVKDKDGNVYNDLAVNGNLPYVNANEKGYTITLTLADPNYSATKVVTLIINKIDPATDFEQIFETIWSPTLKLSDIVLPEGYTWANTDKRIEKAGTESYAVTFTPNDTTNYNSVSGEFTVKVGKATPEIKNASDEYTHIYDGTVYTITGVTASNNGTITYTYADGSPFTGVTDKGTYNVIITLVGSENYNAVEKQVTIEISPAENTQDRVTVVQNQGIYYGDPISKIALPESKIGTWSIKGNPSTVGNAGENTFVAVFTPGTQNYLPKEVEIKVTVLKKVVSTPKATTPTNVYDSTTKYSGLTNTALYTVVTDGAINVGTYRAKLELVDPANHAWDYVENTSKTTEVEYAITKATITFETKPEVQEEWTFTPGQTIPLPVFDVDQDFVPAEDIYFEYQYSADGGISWTGWTRWTNAAAPATFKMRSVTNAPSMAGMYRVRAIVTGTDNYDQITTSNNDIVEFVIHKAQVVVPTYTKQYPYEGVDKEITANIPTSDLYSIKYVTGTYVGDVCYATLTLADSTNYKWVEEKDKDGKYGHSNAIQLDYAITAASPELDGLTAPDSVFGQDYEPSVTENKFWVNITYTYSATKDGIYTETKPTNAGTYWVKATFVGNQNILAQTIGPVSFEISKASAEIQNAQDSYTFVYNGSTHTIPTNVKASNGVTLMYTYEDGITPFTGVTNAGTYKVIITLPETDNYVGDRVNVTIVVDPAQNEDYLKPVYNATYGDSISKLEEQLPTGSAIGAWSIDTEETTVGDAGLRTFVAVFTPYEQYKNNYAIRREPITVNVAKAVLTPSIPNKVYNGEYQLSGLNDSRYTVAEFDNGEGNPKGGKGVGSYTVTLTLTTEAAKNFAWTKADNAAPELQVSYTIIKEENLEFTNSIDIEGWIYKQYSVTDNAYTSVEANKNFANALIQYQYASWNSTTGKWSDWTAWTDPANLAAGQYKIRAIIVGTANYNGVESNEKEFTVQKAGVVVPTYTQQYPYTTKPVEADIPTSGFYTIKYTTGTNVGDTCYATLALKDPTNYKWVESEGNDGKYGHSNAVQLNYEIIAASPELDGLTAPNYVFGKEPDSPSVSSNKFGVQFTPLYYYDQACTQPIDVSFETLPVGTYYVKVTFAGNRNILTQTIGPASFKVTEASASITINNGAVSNNETISKDYNGTAGYTFGNLFTSLKGSHNESELTYTVDGELVDATTFKFVNVKANDAAYTVVITLPASHNYTAASVTIFVKINAIENTDTFEPSYNVTYGDLISKLEEQLPENEFGAWTIDTDEVTVGDVATGKIFTAVFTPYDQYKGNYATRTQTITVNIAQASVDIVDKYEQELPEEDGRDYNGQSFVLPEEVQTSNGVSLDPVITKDGEEVSEIKGVGTYIVTYTYAGDSNHKPATATITVTIAPATIEFEGDLTVQKPAWTFAPDLVIPMPSVGVKQDFVATEEIYYQYQYSADNSAWSAWTDWTTTNAPQKAGWYRVKAIVDATANYGRLETAEEGIATFVINKAEVIVPTYTQQYPYKGAPVEADIPESGDYSIVYTTGTNVGDTCYATLALKDPTNYKWVESEGNDGKYGNSGDVKLYYSIIKANVNISIGAAEWTYGESIVVPGVTITKDFTNPDVVPYDLKYSVDNGTTWKDWNAEEISKLSAATYKVRVIVTAAPNYNGKTVDGTFKVNPKQDAITGINQEKSYTTNYTGNAYTFAGLGAALNTKPEFEYAYKQGDGEWITGTPTNHGTYTVRITLKNSTNYTGISEEVTLEIKKAPNTDIIDVDTTKAIYGNLVLGAIQLPNNDYGVWSIVDVDADTTFASAGNDKLFVAIFTPYDQYKDNYAGDRREITVNVAQASVTITDKDGNALPTTDGRDYNGSAFILPDGVKTSNNVPLVPVIEKKNAEGEYEPHTGAIETVGKYRVTYSYTDANGNFADAEATIIVTITSATVTVPAPSIDGWEYGKYDEDANEPSIGDFTFKSELNISYKYYSDANCTNEVANIAAADADTYWVKAIVTTTNTNLVIDAANAKTSFQIQKAPIYITNPDGTTLTTEHILEYTGEAINPLDIIKISNGSCTFTVDGFANKEIKDRGEYTIVYTVEETKNYLGKTATVIVTINKANVTLNSIEITPWIYKQYNAVTNAAKVTLAGGYEQYRIGAIIFEYYSDSSCTQKITDSTVSGYQNILNNLDVTTYYVRAFFAGDNNLNPTQTAVEDAVAFTLDRAPITLSVAGDAIISKTYDKNQTIAVPGVTAYNNKNQQVSGLNITILINGEDHNNVVIKNQGTYIITYSFAGNQNYAPTTETKTVTVNIAKVTNTEVVNQSQSAVYGESVLTKVTLPTGVEGTWYLATYDATTETYIPVAEGTTFQSATEHTFYAVYVPDENGNYEREPVKIIVTVGQLGILAPTVNNITYDGNHHNSGIQDREGYANFDYFVVEGSDQGGSNHNDYTVILELKRPDVHKWTLVGNAQLVDGNAARVIITYSISEAAQNWKDGKHPTIDSEWQYQKPTANAYGYAEAEHGGVAYYYTDYNNGEYTFALSEAEKIRPVYPGEYVVRIITTDTNYDIKYQDLKFTITPREISIPEWTELRYSYTGDFTNPYNSGLSSLIEGEYTIYTITEDARDRVNVGDYSAIATLNNPEGKIYYVWDDGNPDAISTDADAKTFTYHIVANKIVISGLTINGWEYTPNNANAQAPTYDLKLKIENNYINITDADKLKVDFTVRYYDSQTDELIVDENGNPTVPTQAGTYYVTVQVTPKAGYNNLTASNVATSNDFTIEQATITEFEGIEESYGRPYNDEPFDKTAFETAIREANPGFGLSFTYYLNGALYTGVIEDANEYRVVITLDEATDNNYNLTTDGETKIVIEQITVDLTDVTFNPVTYGQSIDAILNQIPAGKRTFGNWALEETTLGDVGENKAFTAIFTSTNTNYKDNKVTITVSVAKAPLAFKTPTASELTAKYTNSKFTAPTVTALNSITEQPTGLEPVITITAITGDTTKWSVGTYSVTYTFAGGNNYEDGSTTVTFTVTPAQITFTGAPSIANGGWTYHPQNANLMAPSNTVVQTYAQGAVYFEYMYSADGIQWPDENDPENWTRWSVTAPKNAGYYKVRAVVDDDNTDGICNYYGATSAAGSFKIEKAPASLSGIRDDKLYTKTYDGKAYDKTSFEQVIRNANTTYGLDFIYSPSGDIINKGDYSVTITLDAETAKNYTMNAVVVTIRIEQATVELENLVVNNNSGANIDWTFGGAMQVPSVDVPEYAEEKVYYQYQYKNPTTGEWSEWITWKMTQEGSAANEINTIDDLLEGIPAAAGLYRLRAVVDSDTVYDNYIGDTTTPDNPEEVVEYFEFEIKKAPVVINPGISDTEEDYDGKGIDVPVPSVKNSAGDTLEFNVTLEIKKNGEIIATLTPDENGAWPEYSIVNAGEYTLTYTVDVGNDTNYTSEGITETVTITINQIDAPEFKNAYPEATYGDNLLNLIKGAYTDGKLPYGWSIVGVGETTTVGNVNGNNTFTAVFANDGNYTETSDVTFTITVHAKSVNITGVNNDKLYTQPYKGAAYTIDEIKALINASATGLDSQKLALSYAFKVAGTTAQNVGEYKVIISLDSSETNYTADPVEVTFKVEKVTTIDITGISGITNSGWTYGQYTGGENKAQGTIPSFISANAIQYQYLYSADGQTWPDENVLENWKNWPATQEGVNALNAGHYKLKATIADGGENYNGDEYAISFQIEKATTTVSGITNGQNFFNPYRGSAYTVQNLFGGITATRGETTHTYTDFTYTNKVTGEEFTGITNVSEGTVTVLISLDANTNYKPVEFTVYVKINPIDGPTLNKTEYNATYGDNVLSVFTGENALPDGWTLQGVDENTKVGDVGNRTFTAVFNLGDNYNAQNNKTITIVVAKADASITGVLNDGIKTTNDKTQASNGDTIALEYRPGGYSFEDIFASLNLPHTDTELTYYVDGMAINTGTKVFDTVQKTGNDIDVYTLVITLPTKDGCNFKTATLTVNIKIMPANAPRISQTEFNNIVYGSKFWNTIGALPNGWSIQGINAGDVAATVGNVGANTFTAVFANSDNYNYQAPVTITINVVPMSVEISGVNNDKLYTQPYKGAAYTFEQIKTLINAYAIGLGDERLDLGYAFEVEGTTAQNVGEYKVVISLNETNYTADPVEVTFKVEKVSVTFTGFSASTEWTFGQNGTRPSAVGAQQFVYDQNLIVYNYRYSTDGESWTAWTEWTDTTNPATLPAGYYQLQAIVADGGNNYAGITIATAEDAVAFTINPETTSITIQGSNTFTTEYTGAPINISNIVAGKISNEHGLAIKYMLNGVKVETLTGATTYNLVVVLDETDANYNNYTLENDVAITIIITPKKIVISDLTVPTWEYNVNAKPDPQYGTNIPDADKDDVVFTFKYYKQNGTYLGDGVTPTDAGWYYVVVTATLKNGNTNLTASDDAKSPDFQITAKPITLSGATDGDRIEKDYDGSNYKTTFENAIKNANSAFADKLVFSYTKNGVDGAYEGDIKNQGTYVVTITLKNTETNHTLAPVTVTIVIKPIEADADVDVADQITFNDKVFEKITLPTVAEGSWSLKIGTVDGTAVGGSTTFTTAGNNITFWAVFTPDANGNYYHDPVEVTVNVQPKSVTISGVTNNQVFTGTYKGGAYSLADIETIINNAATIKVLDGSGNALDLDLGYAFEVEGTTAQNVGEYKVVISLNETNYAAASVTVIFKITPATVSFGNISINGWEYGQYNAATNKATVSATVNGTTKDVSGEVTFEYYRGYSNNTFTNKIELGNDPVATLKALSTGTYYVRAVVNTTNYAGASTEPKTVVVSAHKVEAPNFAQSAAPTFIYNGAAQYLNIEKSDYYSITWSCGVDAQGIPTSKNVGTYTVTLKLTDANCTWDDQSVTDKQYTYTIGTATTSINISAPANKTYNGQAYAYTSISAVSVEKGTAIAGVTYIVEYFRNDGKNAQGQIIWTSLGNSAPVNAGDYKIRVTVEANTFTDAITGGTVTNYTGDADEVEFSISKATLVYEDPTFSSSSNKYYMNQFDPEDYEDDIVVKYATAWDANGNATSYQEVTGTWSWGAKTFNAGTSASKVAFTFTPNGNFDPNNFTQTSQSSTFSVTFVTVAKLVPKGSTLANGTPYGTIEDAVVDARSDGTVWVCPFDLDLAKGDNPQYPTIKTNITINQGVTLLLPYVLNGESKQNGFDEKGIIFDLHGGTDYDSDPREDVDYSPPSYGVAGYCYVKVIVAQGVTIQNNGTIDIAAQLSSGNGGAPYSGHVGGQYAELLLDTDAKIINGDPEKGLNGTIRAAGYISEVVGSTNSQVIINNGSVIWMPYVVRDFQGGSFSYAIKNSWSNGYPITAFNQFVFMNVSPMLTIHQGGTLSAWAGLYASDQHNTTTVEFIGGANAVIEMNQTGSYLTAKYNTANEVCELHIYGGAITHPMVLEVMSGVTVSTESCFFPISYHYNVTLHKLEGQTEANYTMNQKFKLMPGAVFTVDEGVKVDATMFIVYTEATPENGTYVSTNDVFNGFLTGNAGGGTIPVPYPTSATLKSLGVTSDCTTGTLTVNGTLICGTLGGKVYSDNPGAKVIINNSTTYTVVEARSHNGALSFLTSLNGYNKFVVNAEFVDADGTINTALATPAVYRYMDGNWIAEWSINFDSNKGSTISSIPVYSNATTYPELQTPTREHYEFVGWFDANENLVVGGKTALPSITGNTILLTARWKPKNYNLNYEWKFEGFDVNPTIALPSAGTFNIESGTLTIPTPTGGEGTFVGWHTDAACKNLIISITGEELLAISGGDATIYGLWAKEVYSIKYENDHYDDVPYVGDSVIYAPSQLQNATLPTVSNKYETDTSINKYFDGWYYDGAKVTDLSFLAGRPCGEYILTAKWIDKVSITYTANNTSIYTDLVSYGTHWYKSGTVITLPNVTANDGVSKGDAKKYYFGSWTLNGGAFAQEGNTKYTLSANTEINITWANKVLFQLQVMKATITVNGDSALSTTSNSTSAWTTENYYCKPNTTISYKISYGSSSNRYGGVVTGLEAEPSNKNGMTSKKTEGTFVPDGEKKVAASSETTGCFAAGTLVTLADGTVKKIEDVMPTDILLAFDHETGKLVATEIMLIETHDGWRYYDIINVRFSNGTVTRIINEHGFFNKTLNKYVYITPDNYNDFVGHEFVVFNGEESDTVILEEAFMTYEYTGIYNIVTKYQLNCISDGLLSMSGGMEGTINIFEYDENMKYDEEKMQADIEKYGLFTYEDFSAYVSEDVYNMFPAAYFKVAIGKGYTTYEKLIALVEEYLVKHGYVTP